MGGFLANFAFMNPWALAGLLALPSLYLLLRITPPAPRILHFPAARFLDGLRPKQNTPNHTPWWILLLRLMIAALLIFALAQPVLNPAPKTAGSGAALIVVDNGWGAAQNWADIQDGAARLIEGRNSTQADITIFTTAVQDATRVDKTYTKTQAASFIRALTPQPWDSDLRPIKDIEPRAFSQIVYFSDGLEKNGLSALKRLAEENNSDLQIFSPADADLPLMLYKDSRAGGAGQITIDAPSGADISAKPIRVQAVGKSGVLLDEQRLDSATLSGMEFPATLTFNLEGAALHDVHGYQIAATRGVNARYDLDGSGGPKSVRIATSGQPKSLSQQYTQDSFYIGKALEPFASVAMVSIDQILDEKPSMIVLPDIAAMLDTLLNDLQKWVEDGGVLLRFAGPNMTQGASQNALLPVPLRFEQRRVEGALTWEKPLKVKDISPESPLYGLDVDPDIEVTGQILPDLVGGNSSNIWASLEDDTPLISAAQMGDGLLVFVHTTASPAWSNMPLSGFYVQFLKHLLKFAGTSGQQMQSVNGALQPARVFDGFGQLQTPASNVRPIDAKKFDEVIPSPEHPPGFYGSGAFTRALNLGDRTDMPRAISSADSIASNVVLYEQEQQKNLATPLMIIAFILLMIDALVMMFISKSYHGLLGIRRGKAPLAVLVLMGGLLFAPQAVMAQNAPAPLAAQDFYLGYIKTGNAQIDQISQKGLEVLAAALNIRTSAEPKGVLGVDPAKDILAFYPILYWPLTPSQDVPSAEVLANLQNYMDQGGSIFIDTRGADARPILQKYLAGLNIPPLQTIPANHVIRRSFYLIDDFPGRLTGGDLWVVNQSLSTHDGVSTLMIGGHDWAGGWSEMNVITRGTGDYVRQYISGLDRDQELSLRFGINLVMYALTGNYKTDQVHVNTILERLGTGSNSRSRPRNLQERR